MEVGDVEVLEESWNCSFCTFLNHPALQKCECCEKKRIKALPVVGGPHEVTADHHALPLIESDDFEVLGESWICSFCTFLNHPSLQKCECCEKKRISFPVRGDWLYIEEEELSSHGIGVHIPLITTGKSKLTVDSLNQVLKSQTQLGYWEMDATMESLLGINMEICRNVMKEAGLLSMGEKVFESILQLIATSIVMMSVMKLLLPDLFPLNFRAVQQQKELQDKVEEKLEKLFDGPTAFSSNPCDALEKAMTFCLEVNKHYPMIYSSLELGYCWEEVVGKMLGVHEIN